MKANEVYVILSVAAVEYHWGIYVVDNDEGGIVHHVNNATGGWTYERKHIEGLLRSKMLALALKE